MHRRDFLRSAPAAAGLLSLTGSLTGPLTEGPGDPPPVPGAAPAGTAPTFRSVVPTAAPIRLHAFDYNGVRLLDSRWKRQVELARDFYFGLTNDDILHGFRAEAGLPAPGSNPVRGWGINDTAGAIVGQWLGGMARLSHATGDGALAEKAAVIMDGWGRTLPASGDPQMSHYGFDKFVGGLVDMHMYAGGGEALPLLEKITDYASRNYNRDRIPASAASFFGSPNEWYTLGENLYRAYQATGDERFRSFAEVWLYDPFWEKFASSSSPTDAHGVHAYSHVNTFSSAAMHYEITADPEYLDILRNAHEYLQNVQCYATGGYGPDERFLAPYGGLGRALDVRPNTFETICGSWAGFKLTRYLTRFTGEAHYGDWLERLFYNGVGAALPITTNGRNFYYSDYRVGGGMKVYRYDPYTCCSGTYFQCMADFHNLLYYHDDEDLYVNLYVPSEVRWDRGGVEIRLVQETGYPETDTSELRVRLPRPASFSLYFRVPQWCDGFSVAVNGTASQAQAQPGTWARVARNWRDGDRVQVNIPQRFRWQAVDRYHPDRAAIVRGAVVMPLEFRYVETDFRPPQSDEELNAWLEPDTRGEVVKGLSSHGAYLARGRGGRFLPAKVRPFYQYTENYPYLMYMDRSKWPAALW